MVAEFSADYFEMRFANREAHAHEINIADYIADKIGTGKTTPNGEFEVKIDDFHIKVYEKKKLGC